LRELCEQIDGHAIEREARIPDEVVKGLKDIGALGMKIPEEYGGLGLSQVYYNRALMLVSSVHASLGALLSAHQSIGVPQPVKLFGSDACTRSRRSC
jgi:alkylation response protein AidB-like acyl-CoA dehydrogenase